MNEGMQRFVDGASRLPVFAGMVWRAARFEIGAPFTSDAPIPTSRDLRVATENFRVTGAQLFITCAARDISALATYPSDQEVVLLPGARLVPASSRHAVEGVQLQVILEQPAADRPIRPVPSDEEITALVRAARKSPDVAVHYPGRYGA